MEIKVFPRKRTSLNAIGMSETCQIRKSCRSSSSNHTDADSGARSLIQIKLALSGTHHVAAQKAE